MSNEDNINEITTYCELIFYKINSILGENSQKTIVLDFGIIEDNLFLFSEIENGKMKEKTKINVDLEDLASLYKKIYELFLQNYLESETRKISILKVSDLSDANNHYLNLRIRDIHRTEINFYLKDLGLEREILNQIEENWISLVEEYRKRK